MKKFSLLVLIAALVSFAAVSCKKYEEGPAFSLASKKGRVAGKWTVESGKISNDGTSTDATDETKDFINSIEFTKDGDVTWVSDGDTYTGTWDFDDDKENIIVTIDGDTITLEILRLKSKELWVIYTPVPDYEWEIHLKQ